MFNASSYAINPPPIRAWLTEGGVKSRGWVLPWLPAIYQVRFTAGAGTDDTVWSVINDATEVEFSATGTGSATEATMLDNAVAALIAEPNINGLFSIEEDGVEDVTFTARMPNRSYTISATGGPSATAPVTSTLQEPGGSKLAFGFVALADGYLAAVDSSTELEDIAGFIRYADAAYYRETWEDTEIAVERGKKHSVVYEGHVWAPYEGTAPTVGGSVYLRRAQTSSAGTVGSILAAPAGSAQVSTYTPVADALAYGFEYGYNGQHYVVHYVPTDGTTAVADAVDGLVAQANVDAPTGVTITDTATEVTITTAAGTELDYLRATVTTLDADTAAGVAALGTADVDAIDLSPIAEVIEVNPTGFVKLFVRI